MEKKTQRVVTYENKGRKYYIAEFPKFHLLFTAPSNCDTTAGGIRALCGVEVPEGNLYSTITLAHKASKSTASKIITKVKDECPKLTLSKLIETLFPNAGNCKHLFIQLN